MHLFALDDKDQIISAANAKKQSDYQCLECRSLVRVRGGFIKQLHYYHIDPNRECRQSGKTLKHLKVQEYIQQIFPEAILEKRFSSINRIADVCLEKHKIIFEVQCSSIKAKEIEERNRDYNQLGYQVIWILHDHLYNKERLSAAEYFLQESCHYFTDIDEEGRGIIYDQWDIIRKGRRESTLEIKEVFISSFRLNDSALFPKKEYPHWIRKRISNWNYFFTGDCLDFLLSLNEEEMENFFNKIQEQEVNGQKKSLIKEEPILFSLRVRDFFKNVWNFPYRLQLRLVVEQLSQ